MRTVALKLGRLYSPTSLLIIHLLPEIAREAILLPFSPKLVQSSVTYSLHRNVVVGTRDWFALRH